MKITFKNDLQDLIAFNKYAVNTLPLFKKKKRFFVFIFPILLLVAVGFFSVRDRDINQLFIGLLIIVIYEICYFIIHKRGIPRMITKLSKDQSFKTMLGEHTMEITEEGIIEKTEFNERTDYWKSITGIKTDNDRTYIFIGPINAHVINRNEILSGDLNAFVEEINNKLKQTSRSN